MIEGYENNLSVAQRWDEPLRNITPKNLRPPVPRGSSLADGKFDVKCLYMPIRPFLSDRAFEPEAECESCERA